MLQMESKTGRLQHSSCQLLAREQPNAGAAGAAFTDAVPAERRGCACATMRSRHKGRGWPDCGAHECPLLHEERPRVARACEMTAHASISPPVAKHRLRTRQASISAIQHAPAVLYDSIFSQSYFNLSALFTHFTAVSRQSHVSAKLSTVRRERRTRLTNHKHAAADCDHGHGKCRPLLADDHVNMDERVASYALAKCVHPSLEGSSKAVALISLV